jgi:hypothetical protein
MPVTTGNDNIPTAEYDTIVEVYQTIFDIVGDEDTALDILTGVLEAGITFVKAPNG